MVVLKIFALEDTKEEHASLLAEGEHVVGRGALNCNDKRISRKHAVINVYKDSVTIKAIHINPCFFKAAEGGSVTILAKDTSAELHDGDQFAFLASLFWFKVRLSQSDNPTNNPSTSKRDLTDEGPIEILKRQKISNEIVETLNQISDIAPHRVESDSPNNLSCQLNASSNMNTENIDPRILISNLNTIVNEDYGNERNNLSGSVLIKKEIKTEKIEEAVKENEEQEAAHSDTGAVESNGPNTNKSNIKDTLNHTVGSIKTEAIASDTGQTGNVDNIQKEYETSNTANNVNDNEHEKKDEGTSSNPDTEPDTKQNDPSCSTNDNKTRRERCWYGPTCYRKNPIHRADFSHPGDNDYDSDPNDDRPMCPFGATCYRKNLLHRRQYKHSNPPAPKPSKVNLQVNVNSFCPHCSHCNNRSFQKPDYESDYDSDYES